jgi:hypothetical protein
MRSLYWVLIMFAVAALLFVAYQYGTVSDVCVSDEECYYDYGYGCVRRGLNFHFGDESISEPVPACECVNGTCEIASEPESPDDSCEIDADCIKEPCCYSCNSKEYADYLVENNRHDCMAVSCTIDFNCTCVNNVCQASNRAY